MRARSLVIGSWPESESKQVGKIEEGIRTMLNTVQQVLDQTLEIPVAKVPAKSRTLSFIIQVTAICVLLAAGLFGFAWMRTGSMELVWPWLRGDRLVFEPMRIDFGTVPKTLHFRRTSIAGMWRLEF